MEPTLSWKEAGGGPRALSARRQRGEEDRFVDVSQSPRRWGEVQREAGVEIVHFSDLTGEGSGLLYFRVLR